jgi:hypothetical protein
VGEARRRTNEAANPPTHATPIATYVDKAALAKAGFVEAPSSCPTMTAMTIAEIWDREKANLRRGFRGRQADLSPYLDLAQCEAEARRGVERLQKTARAEKRAAFDKARETRPSGRRLNNRLTGGMIVGVDCEGILPWPFTRHALRAFDAGKKKLEFDIDVCLWATGKVSRSWSPYEWLIVSWLDGQAFRLRAGRPMMISPREVLRPR